MSDPTNTDAASVEYPDGSKPPVDPETGLPVLEDRSGDFPDVDATEVIAEPIVVTRDGRRHRIGPDSGTTGYRGLLAKRGEKGGATEPESAEQGQEGGQEAPEGSGGTDYPSGDENGPETGAQGSGDDASGSEGDSSTPDEPEQPATDKGYDPAAHTVDEVQAYLTENPDQATYVLDRERASKARKTLIGA